jgi:5-methylthioadenosine/S-adenosylhomocysteine deaminase
MLLTAKYVLPVSRPCIEDGAVLVREGAIADVGTRKELEQRYPGELARDFGLAALMPGFVDLHTHLEYHVFRGIVDDLPYSGWKMQVSKLERNLSAEDWEDSAYLGAMESIASGITSIADITNSGASLKAAASAGLGGIVYREVSTMDKSKVTDRLAAAADDIEDWESRASAPLLRVGIAPHSPYTCHPTLFEAAAQLAIDRDLPTAIHLAGSHDEFDFVKYGSSPLAQDFREQSGWNDLAWMPTGVSPVKYVQQWGLYAVPNLMAVHCVQVDDYDIEILAENDVSVAHCPRCNAKLGMGIAPLRQLLERDLRVGMGTDSPASNNTVDMFDEMRIGLLLQRGVTGAAEFFTAERFVRMATLEGARAVRAEARVGSLETGKQADVIAVDLSRSHQVPTRDPASVLVHSANAENVVMTMVAGHVLYDDGEYLTVDSERALARASEIRVKLRA